MEITELQEQRKQLTKQHIQPISNAVKLKKKQIMQEMIESGLKELKRGGMDYTLVRKSRPLEFQEKMMLVNHVFKQNLEPDLAAVEIIRLLDKTKAYKEEYSLVIKRSEL